jgi:hypothetical protein
MFFDITIEKCGMRKGSAFNGGSFAGIGFLIASLGATFPVSVRADVYDEARPIIDIKNGKLQGVAWLYLTLSRPKNP